MRFLRRLIRLDERGQAQTYVALAVAVPLFLAACLAGSGVIATSSVQAVLHNAAEMADRSITTNGCLTDAAVQQIASYLKTNGLNPDQVSITAPTTLSTYGQTVGGSGGPAVQLSYEATVYLPLTSVAVWHPTVTVSVPVDTSQFVASAVPVQSQCASGSDIAEAFPGGSGGSGGSSGSSYELPTVSSITVSAAPDTVEEGDPVTVSGQALIGSSPAPSGTVIVLSYDGGETSAVVDANGRFSAIVSFEAPGRQTVTVSAGTASAQAAVTVDPPVPTSIELSAPSSVEVAQPLTISGMLLDQDGKPVADGTQVSISSTDSADFPATTASTTDGEFTFSFPGATSLGSVTFTVTAGQASATAAVQITPGPPQSVTLSVAPSSGTAGGSFTLSGRVLGPDGTPVAQGTQVTISSPDDAQDPMPTLTADANGDFSGSVTLTEAGTVDLVASAGGVSSPVVGVEVLPGAPSSVSLQAVPDPVPQGGADMISGAVTDAYGNPVAAGTPITLSSAAFAHDYTATVGSGGQFSEPVSFDSPGVDDVTASYGGTVLGTVAVQVDPQGAYVITASQAAASVTAGSTTSATFTVTDENGNPAPNLTLDITESPEGAQTLSATQVVTNAQGQATVYVTPTKAGTAVVSASVDSSGGVSSGTAVWTVAPAAPSQVVGLAITPSIAQSTQDGGTMYPVVSGVVEDQYGNPIPGATVTVTGGWSSSATTATTGKDGSFSGSIDPVNVGGPYYPAITVQASSGTLSYTAKSTSLTVVTSLYSLQLVGLSGTYSGGGWQIPAGTPFVVEATITDIYGNSVANVPVTFTVSGTDASGSSWSTGTPVPSGPNTITVNTNSSGQAVAEVAFEPYTGTMTVNASASGGPHASIQVDVTDVAPTQVVWNQFSPTTVTAGGTISFAVQFLDSYNFPVPLGDIVQYTFDGASGFSVTSTWSGLSGVATGTVTVTKAGTYSGQVQINGQVFNSPTFTVNPGPLGMVASYLSSWYTGQLPGPTCYVSYYNSTDYYAYQWSPIYPGSCAFPMGDIAYIVATDRYGNPISGATVTFSGFAFGTAATNSSGYASGSSTGWWETVPGYSHSTEPQQVWFSANVSYDGTNINGGCSTTVQPSFPPGWTEYVPEGATCSAVTY
jgi:protocatechuate 3,4-dioxygenase beta subunit